MDTMMTTSTSHSTMNLMSLPIEMIDKILSYLSFDQIAKLRAVNRMFNTICSDKLNKGFIYVNQFHNRCLKAVRTQLPRRESERRQHPLARHSDILMAVETRLSMLSMTFSKYIEAHQCCFIPGKVLDEAFKVLRIVSTCSTPLKYNGQFPFLPRPHDFLQEYRDYSSMAMEHFDDKILPGIREKMRLEMPSRLYCFKNKDILVPTRTIQLGNIRTTYKIPQVAPVPRPSTSTEASESPPSFSMGTAGRKKPDGTVPAVNSATLVRLYKGMQVNKLKFKSVHQSVDRLHRTMKQISKRMKLENMLLKRQLVQQKVTIKHLRREVRETRAAMNVISKDLSQIKMDQSMDQSTSRGTKRKRETCEEDCLV